MVVSVGTASDVGYYGGGGGGDDEYEETPNYYTGSSAKGDPAGRWGGTLAPVFGLKGTVDDGQMEKVYGTFTAPDGTKLGQAPSSFQSPADRVAAAVASLPADALPEEVDRVAREATRSTRSAVLGVDLTANADKSFSVARAALERQAIEATRSGDSVGAAHYTELVGRLESCLTTAADSMVAYATDNMVARAGRHDSNGGRFVEVTGTLVASFHQHTSRAGDPHEHVHNVILNRALCEDDQYRALDAADVMARHWSASAVFHRVLSEEAAKVGLEYGLRPGAVARELTIVPQEMSEELSQRRQAITKAIRPVVERFEERYGRAPNPQELRGIKQSANFRTREAKDEANTNPDRMIERAQQRLTEQLGTGLLPLATRVEQAMTNGRAAASDGFSASVAMQAAVAASAEKYTSFTVDHVMHELDLQLPAVLGLAPEEAGEFLELMAEQAIQEYTDQVSGHEAVSLPPGLVAYTYTRPSDVRYATPLSLAAEDRIRQAGIQRGGTTVTKEAAAAWLDENYKELDVTQRAAVIGMATSDAMMTRLIGPAGTGKTYTAGAFAQMWEDLTGGKVHGLTASTQAANVLREDGVVHSSNIDLWLVSQQRATQGNAEEGDQDRLLGPRDRIMIDEASMANRSHVTRVMDVAQPQGVAMTLMGDDHQLPSVGPGGTMSLADTAETHTLSDVRRFESPWEAQASLQLRDGSVAGLAEYDKHGRIVGADTLDDAVATVARACAADRLAGKNSVVYTDTNEIAARISDAIRVYLVEAGQVVEDGVELARTGSIAGVGDLVMTRQNDRGLGVINRDVFTVAAANEDGSLVVANKYGEELVLPAGYVDAHTQLGYASTAHSGQGATVDTAYNLSTPSSAGAESEYVKSTRGRESNVIVVVMDVVKENAPYVNDPTLERTPFDVLADRLERSAASKAALIQLEEDMARISGMGHLMSRIEDASQAACRARLESDLDELVHDGVLSIEDRAQFSTDQSTEHLSHVLRAAEQSGIDPQQALRDAITERSFEGLNNIVQGVAGRLDATHGETIRSTAPLPEALIPARIPEAHVQHLEALYAKADDRARELASQVAQQAPEWATRQLGPVPDDPMAQLEWEAKVAKTAAFREAKEFDAEKRALPNAPGVTKNEQRAAWWGAREGLGFPEETRADAELTDGQLHLRVAAWQQEQQWAPPHADASLQDSELRARESRQEAVLAASLGEAERAAELEAEADRLDVIARGMTRVADARAAWEKETEVTRDMARHAERELEDRDLKPGSESDRTTAAEWLEHQREVDAREEPVKEITELDVTQDNEPVELEYDESLGHVNTTARENDMNETHARTRAPIEPDEDQLESMVSEARQVEEVVADRDSEETTHDEWEATTSAAPEPEWEAPDDVSEAADAGVAAEAGV